MKNILPNPFAFTLLELLIVIGMLAVLFTTIAIALNPAAQINKANDARREHDISAIRQGLDAYYNDHKCYPSALNFGGILADKITYIQKVPQDPDCSNGNGICYMYEVDSSSSCPQWNIVFAGLRNPNSVTDSSCALTKISSCLPINFYSSSFNYCQVSGDLDCNYISTNQVQNFGGGGGGGGNNGGGGGAGGNGPGASPTPTPEQCQGNYYACTGSPARCNVESSNHCAANGGPYACFCNLQSCVSFCGQ